MSLILLMSVGVISILIGKQYLIKQEKNIVAAQKFQEESIKNNVAHHGEDLGLLLYYLRFTLIKEPLNISAISIRVMLIRHFKPSLLELLKVKNTTLILKTHLC
ncbi:hypothetical protein [Flavobacterium sp. 7A]|uniref:hypothetical protein n=1 Tax=Flavobacterium sp. 7A TaxID=2940571 RepID=UPI002226EEDF|nr:hypothetical protein [Flavobacterium sp. 7A]